MTNKEKLENLVKEFEEFKINTKNLFNTIDLFINNFEMKNGSFVLSKTALVSMKDNIINQAHNHYSGYDLDVDKTFNQLQSDIFNYMMFFDKLQYHSPSEPTLSEERLSKLNKLRSAIKDKKIEMLEQRIKKIEEKLWQQV